MTLPKPVWLCNREDSNGSARMSQITVVALLCHSLAGISGPVCHEEVVVKNEMPMQLCALAQPLIADWKEKSRFSGEQWNVVGFHCEDGDYVPRDAI
jgi:hypothetical protein